MNIDAMSQTMRELFDATESQYNLEVQLAIKNNKNKAELLKSLRQVRKKSDLLFERVTQNASKAAHFNAKPLLESNNKMSKMLIRTALKEYSKGKAKVRRLERIMPIKEAIYKQNQEGIDKALKIKVNNRNYGYKEYMEMNVRTTMQQEIGEQQLESGKDANVVFYMSNFFGDSADDHADWQGKIFYDERYKTFGLNDEIKDQITKFIRSKKLKSVQWVRDKPVYLTTRPNCRHTITAISIQQAMGIQPEVLLSALQLKRGTYKDKNYKLTQQQRYNERMIRKYKQRAESNDKLGYDNKEDKQMVTRWQKRNRELVRTNPQLERDYRRESKKVLVTDLGAKYNK